MTTLNLNGTTYNALFIQTVEEIEAAGMARLAADLRTRGIDAQAGLQKPKGRKTYLAYRSSKTGEWGNLLAV